MCSRGLSFKLSWVVLMPEEASARIRTAWQHRSIANSKFDFVFVMCNLNLNPSLPRQCGIYAAASAVAAQTAGFAIARECQSCTANGGSSTAQDTGMSACTRALIFVPLTASHLYHSRIHHRFSIVIWRWCFSRDDERKRLVFDW